MVLKSGAFKVFNKVFLIRHLLLAVHEKTYKTSEEKIWQKCKRLSTFLRLQVKTQIKSQ